MHLDKLITYRSSIMRIPICSFLRNSHPVTQNQNLEPTKKEGALVKEREKGSNPFETYVHLPKNRSPGPTKKKNETLVKSFLKERKSLETI